MGCLRSILILFVLEPSQGFVPKDYKALPRLIIRCCCCYDCGWKVSFFNLGEIIIILSTVSTEYDEREIRQVCSIKPYLMVIALPIKKFIPQYLAKCYLIIQIYNITRGEVSVNTQYFLKRLIFPPKSIQQLL